MSGRPPVDDQLTCIVNTADDLDYAGLHVSPDLDTVSYALAGKYDFERGWGLRDDTFHNAEALRRFGEGWFGIGDEDLATHLHRTELLRGGATLTEATADLAASLGLSARVLPMSDDPIRTVVVTEQGRLPFQDWLVRQRAAPAVVSVELEGIEVARPAPGVIDALVHAQLVVVAPSNPVSSIGPILEVPGVREALVSRVLPTVAITPVVSGREPTTEPERFRAQVREAFMMSRGLEHTAASVAGLYSGFASTFVLDFHDGHQLTAIESRGLEVVLADTLAPAQLWDELVPASA
ncbi:MAG: 2-phospho-L-lactate transferase CofD family protein [Actinomycetota bacterium]|nr:2-phospho-L-lactate transferase CofD family protein [Actinomycetota bacterium]